MISKLTRQRVKILVSKGHSSNSILKKIGITEKTIKIILKPKITQLVGKAKPFRIHETKVRNRPKSKHLLVKEYIENTDTIYSEDMNKLGVAHISTSLNHYAKYNNVKFVQLTHSTWDIVR